MQGRDSQRARLRELSTAQREALLRNLRAERTTAPQPQTIPSQLAGSAPSPLSIPQEHMWLHHQLMPGSTAYHMPLSVRLRGRVDWSALSASLEDLLARHGALRTVYRHEGTALVQAELPPHTVELPVDGVPGATAAERERAVLALGRAEVARPFDLERGPVLRARAFQLSPEDHVLLLTVHHIATDGWSLGILANELALFYLARKSGEQATLPPIPIRYRDFACWQRAEVATPRMQEMLEYWRSRLAGEPMALQLPADHPHGSRLAQASEQVEVTISDDLGRLIQSLAERYAASPFMVLLSALQLLLGRYADCDEVTIGTPIANRTQPETHQVVGLFVNMLALRADLSQARTFAELLQQTRSAALEGYERQALPFQSVVQAVTSERGAGASRALFRALLVLLNTPPVATRVQGLEIEPFIVESGAADHDLVLSLAASGAGFRGALHYNTGLWSGTSMQTLVERYLRLLSVVCIDPDVPLARLQLTSPEEQLELAAWNRTQIELEDEEHIHRSFERQAALRPDAVALRFGDASVSYGSLNGAANRLAADLAAMGYGRGSVVAVALPRSPEAVLAMLAALKVGAAYLPLDPAWPKRRLQAALSDAQARVVVTAPDFGLDLGPNVERLRLSPERAFTQPLAENPNVRLSQQDLAYIIATSGSTGAPKSAMNSHGSLVNRLRWQQATIGLDVDDRVLHKTPATFDVSVWELLWPLMMGAVMVIARPEGHREADYLHELVRRERVTVAHFVPSMLEPFVDLLRTSPLQSLRVVIASGEALSVPLVKRFFDVPGAPRLFNLYGPSEAAIDVTCWACTASSEMTTVPIGRPIANTSIYIVDRYLQSVPPGALGEICIGGRNVGRGYAGRPDWTAERFVPDPFAERASAVMYRTGDVGRWLADGSIEFVGRRDHQVKIRGHRIELGEVEAAALRAPSIRAAVATVGARGGDQLLLYVVAAPGEVANERAILQELTRQLPASLLPRQIICLEALPLTSSGKVDRRALRAPESDAPVDAAPLRGPFETDLAALWSEVLGTPVHGRNAHFFDLGGHSVTLARLGVRLQHVFGAEVPLRFLFDAPVLDEMSSAVALALLESLPQHARESLLDEVEATSATEAERLLATEGWP